MNVQEEEEKIIKSNEDKLYCGNCGKRGHIYRKCNAPITSLGVIVYRVMNNQREYLMIQRRDSLGFVEFIRGKYTLKNVEYICKLFEIMTCNERMRLLHKPFDTLWNELWMNKNIRQYHNEYENSKRKFNKLKEGLIFTNSIVNLESIHKTTPVLYETPEWGFPKGRRNLKETDIECAKREFSEETGLKDEDYIVNSNFGRIEETFSGTNKIRYKHIYYLGKWNSTKKIHIDKDNFSQISEIGNIQWFDYETAFKKIREYNKEKRQVLTTIDNELDTLDAI